jgi:hypothetical protein
MEYMKIHVKCVKKQSVTPYCAKQHEPKGEQANHQANQGPNIRRIRPKPNTNYLNFAPNPHGCGPGPASDPPEQGGRRSALPGCGCTHRLPRACTWALSLMPQGGCMHYIRSLPHPFNTTTHKRAQ